MCPSAFAERLARLFAACAVLTAAGAVAAAVFGAGWRATALCGALALG